MVLEILLEGVSPQGSAWGRWYFNSQEGRRKARHRQGSGPGGAGPVGPELLGREQRERERAEREAPLRLSAPLRRG